MELVSLPLVLLLILKINSEQTEVGRTQTTRTPSTATPEILKTSISGFKERPTHQVSVWPDHHVYRGETIYLTCGIDGGDYSWNYSWYKDSSLYNISHLQNYTIRFVNESDTGNYTCRGSATNRPQSLNISNAVTLTVSALPRAAVNVTPDGPVFTGETVTLKCEIDDQYSNWTYQWYKDTTEVFNSENYTVNSNSLTINGVTESDQSWFNCSAEIHGRPQTSLSSSAVYLTVRALPRATVNVTPDGPVLTGETVTLKCEIDDQYSNWTYQWYKDTAEVFNSEKYTVNSDSLTINGVTKSDQSWFNCSAEIHGRPQTSLSNSAVYLTVRERPTPQVSVWPDHHVYRGETVYLTCVINGGGDYSWKYSWYKDSSLYNISHLQNYTIRFVNESDTGNYTCRGSATKRPQSLNISYVVALTVLALPRATVNVTPDGPVFTGETVTLKCEIEDQYSNWTYQWYKDTTKVFNSENYTVNSDSLTINGVTESDQDEFSCSAEIHGRPQTSLSSSAVYLTVNALPRATVSVTPDRSVFIGETVTLKCEIENQYRSLNWRYLWYKDTTEVLNSVHYSVNRDSLTINGVTESDQDEFWCRGERDGRPQTSQSSTPVSLTVKGSKPKPKLTSGTEGSVLTGNTVTLKCHIDHWSTGWKFYWNKQNTEKTTTETNSYTIHSVRVSDGGQYWCRAGRGNPDYYTDYSDVLWIHVTESPKPVVSVDPDKQLFRGETVTLRCDIQDTGDTEWTYSWTVEPYNWYIVNQCKTQECKINNIQYYHSGKYTCRGKIRGQNTEMSDAVTLTVSSDKPQTVLSVSPQQWLTEGDSVTLMCWVRSSSTGWTFSWFTVESLYSVYQLVSDSIQGSKGIYTVSSVTVKHTGVYLCRAERGDPVYHTEYSNTQTLWITGVSPSVSLIIRPNRSQHFSSESLSLSCEDHSNSRWTVRRYTDKLKPCSSSDWRSTGTTSTCTIRSLNTSDTGVYWCQSESGDKLHPVNISVHHVDVILDSPVHPVTEGDNLTLRCLYRDKNSSNLRSEFYKDGLVVQNQTTGDMMIIPTVSKSHEGFYYCKNSERGESPKSWISVRASSFLSRGLIIGVSAGLGVMFLIIFLVILGIYKNRKAVSPHKNISQTSDQKQSEDDPLQSGDAHIYDSVDLTDNKDTSAAVTQAGPSDVLYSQVSFKKNKLKKKDNASEEADIIYADIELKPKKEMKTKKEKKGSTSKGGDAVYAKVDKKRDVVSGSDDVTYAQIKLKPRGKKRQQYIY